MSKSKKNKHSKQVTKNVGKVLDKLVNPIVTESPVTESPVTEKRIIKSNGEPDQIVNEDPKGNLVLTPEDMAKLEDVKALQATAIQAKIDAKEALRKAQEALQALSGSEAIKAIKQDIEARLASQEAITSKALTVYQEAKEKLNDIQSEYQSLTGIDKKIKATGKAKKSNGNGNGKFETKINQDDDSLQVLVTHKATKNLFEYSLYPANGTIARTDWIKLRHGLTAQFEKETKEEDLTIRAYLSNLKTQIEKIKAIA